MVITDGDVGARNIIPSLQMYELRCYRWTRWKPSFRISWRVYWRPRSTESKRRTNHTVSILLTSQSLYFLLYATDYLSNFVSVFSDRRRPGSGEFAEQTGPTFGLPGLYRLPARYVYGTWHVYHRSLSVVSDIYKTADQEFVLAANNKLSDEQITYVWITLFLYICVFTNFAFH